MSYGHLSVKGKGHSTGYGWLNPFWMKTVHVDKKEEPTNSNNDPNVAQTKSIAKPGER